MRILLIAIFLVSAATVAVAQTKLLTNVDLDKYRIEREKAEREYRENYAKRGFPSPEELERRRRENDLQNQEFVNRMNEQIRAAENLASQRRNSSVYFRYVPTEIRDQSVDYPYFWSYGRGYAIPAQTTNSQPGYFAGGQFWPTPVHAAPPPTVRTPPKPPVRTHPK